MALKMGADHACSSQSYWTGRDNERQVVLQIAWTLCHEGLYKQQALVELQLASPCNNKKVFKKLTFIPNSITKPNYPATGGI